LRRRAIVIICAWRRRRSVLDGADDDPEDETTGRAALKAKIALEALREQASVADLAQRYQQLQEQAKAFETVVSRMFRTFGPWPALVKRSWRCAA